MEGGKVTKVIWNNKKLAGILPVEFGKLSALKYLDLEDSKICGPLTAF